MLSIYLRHLPARAPFSPRRSPSSRRPAAAPAPPCPHPGGGRPGSPEGPDPRASPRWFSGARAVAWGGPSWPNLSPPITPRRFRGLPAPGNRGETRPGRRPRPLSASSETPRRPAFGAPHPAWLPAPRPPRTGARAPRRRARGASAKRPPPPLTCRRSFSATRARPLPGAWTHRLRGLGALGGAGRGTGSRGRRGPLCACAACGLGLGGRRALRG